VASFISSARWPRTLGVTGFTVEIKPEKKAMIDAFVDVRERERSHRAWRFWLAVATASVAALYAVRFEALPFGIRVALVAIGAVGLPLFLVFLSTKSFGRDFYAGPSWWL
jgi:hypothetical protein